MNTEQKIETINNLKNYIAKVEKEKTELEGRKNQLEESIKDEFNIDSVNDIEKVLNSQENELNMLNEEIEILYSDIEKFVVENNIEV